MRKLRHTVKKEGTELNFTSDHDRCSPTGHKVFHILSDVCRSFSVAAHTFTFSNAKRRRYFLAPVGDLGRVNCSRCSLGMLRATCSNRRQICLPVYVGNEQESLA